MSTNTEPRTCPNCLTSEDTGLCQRTTGDGWDDLTCAICNLNFVLIPVASVRSYGGDSLTRDETIAAIRAELIDTRGWSENEVDETNLLGEYQNPE
jgi:hypothetical protein